MSYLLGMLRCFSSLVSKVLVDVDEGGRHDTEESAETKNDKVTDTFGERGLSTEEGLLSFVLRQRGDLDIDHGCVFFG